MKLSIIGGTGKLGYGLAKRFAKLEKNVMIGSRDKNKALAKAKEINDKLMTSHVQGDDLVAAADWGDLVFLTVPFSAQLDTVKQIKDILVGKILIDTTVPLITENPTIQSDRVTSTAEDIDKLIGENSKLVSGFHTISHTVLTNLEKEIDSDVLLCGNDDEAVKLVADLVEELGANPIHVGDLKNARVLERLTPMIIGINKRYNKRHIGIKITGIK
ncbi:NADPH-dependent F420 reductase [Alkalihalobacterium alkalinitrilicum]|uniref:NADPH-dependent F420 reductase n=1 Tax=Alkalihalobacterium alkalinitrilicum TaxID=427920 RepID=UPI000995003E|nr:NADPH-dependent F420 reductase [Alkalihalobacterium alkalinitrilicum]